MWWMKRTCSRGQHGHSARQTRHGDAPGEGGGAHHANREASVRHGEDARTGLSAHPFRLGTGATGWVLLELDRTAAIAATKADARTQLAWMASAMALLSFALWAVLHFGFAARLGQLVDGMRALGEGKADAAGFPQVATKWVRSPQHSPR